MNRETNMYVYMCVYMHAFMYVLIGLYHSMYSSCEKNGESDFQYINIIEQISFHFM